MADAVDTLNVLRAMRDQLQVLFRERIEVERKGRELQRQIDGLQQSAGGLIVYAETLEDADGNLRKAITELRKDLAANTFPVKLTDACRYLIGQSAGWMSAVDVRDALETRGFDFSGYTSNPLSSIHTTLRRLREADTISERNEGGTTVYCWNRKR
jgi:hypothetical protein